jgi:hypothetical protein
VSASQFEHATWGEQALAEPLHQVLVGPFDEERAWLGAVGVELAPACPLHQDVEHAQHVIAGVDERVLHLRLAPAVPRNGQSRCRALPNMISSQEGTEARLLRAVLRLCRPACSPAGSAGAADSGLAPLAGDAAAAAGTVDSGRAAGTVVSGRDSFTSG